MCVKNLTLENVRGFPKLEFDLGRPDGSYAGWTVFVGGNRSGKSTILRGMALALMGPESGGRLMGSTAGWIYKGQPKASSSVTLHWAKAHDKCKTGGAPPGHLFDAGVRWFFEKKDDEIPQFRAVLKLSAKRSRILTPERGPWSPNAYGWFAAGYGPMRRLTGSSSEAMRFSVTRSSTTPCH